jgi:hypothetical protein
MKNKNRAKNTDAASFSYSELAEFLITKKIPIKRATYLLSDGGMVDIGVFNALVGGYKVGVYFHRDADGKLLEGTVCEFKEPGGLEWFQALHQGLLGKSLN